jgi:hypothetical protein
MKPNMLLTKFFQAFFLKRQRIKLPKVSSAGRWKEGDIGRLKDHLRKHSLDSSSGEDQTTYADLLAVPNEDLAPLYNECTARGDALSIWFMTPLIGILKCLKPQDNPDSYRIVALESCFLKGLTILIHWAILDWAEARALIPRFQNGFRPGYRINNNPFILHCLNEWTKASGFKLYVACVDFTNTFPSTDQPTLWLKLFRMGMGGRLFDWLRMLWGGRKG